MWAEMSTNTRAIAISVACMTQNGIQRRRFVSPLDGNSTPVRPPGSSAGSGEDQEVLPADPSPLASTGVAAWLGGFMAAGGAACCSDSVPSLFC